LKLYVIIIAPESGFGTPLKGDTVFGQFCWQAAYDSTLLEGGLERWVSAYPERPFAVFSSAWPTLEGESVRYALKRPDLPIPMLFPAFGAKDKKERLIEWKDCKDKKWMIVGENLDLAIESAEYLTDDELLEFALTLLPTAPTRFGGEPPGYLCHFNQPHNSINRLSGSTGKGGMFAPFTETASFYVPGAKLTLFVLIDTDATEIEKVCAAFERMGKWGLGKDASTGCGRFSVRKYKEVHLAKGDPPNACYTLAPVVPEKGFAFQSFFTPFTRFGKHGDVLVHSGNPFKNPVIMADEGAVFIPNAAEVFRKPYIGTGITNLSKAMPQSVAQGYSIYLPFRMEI